MEKKIFIVIPLLYFSLQQMIKNELEKVFD